MSGLPVRAQGFIISVMLAGACIGGVSVARTISISKTEAWGSYQWWQAISIVCFVLLLSYQRTPLPTYNLKKGAVQSMGSAGHMAALIIFPLPVAILVSATGLLLQQIVIRRPPIKAAVNISMNLLTVAVTGSVLVVLGGQDGRLQSEQIGLVGLAAICVASVVYYCVHVPLWAVFLAYLNGRRVEYTFRINYRTSVIPEMVSIFIGVIAGFLWLYSPALILLIAMPVIITHVSFQSIRRLERETIEAVKALADSIDVRDPYTAQHSVRVAAMARRLAEALVLPDDTIDQIALAAQVHDLGKMTVPVEILGKQSQLTADERMIMEQHPVTGATVLSRYKGFDSSVPIVLHHHERWDGHGYPHGRAGEDIPLGARIIAVADTFDAMTSDRPYRKGMAPSKALQIIAAEAGAQFDPSLAVCFVDMLTADYIAALAESQGAVGRATSPTLEWLPMPTLVSNQDNSASVTVRTSIPASSVAMLTPSAGGPSNEV